jgi:N-acetylmuramoyl-L-alanine amidase
VTIRRVFYAVYALGLFLAYMFSVLSSAVSGQAPNPGGSVTVLSRDGRRPLPTVEMQGHSMVGLDDLANLFQLTIREDAALRAVTVTYKNQTIVLTPDQALASMSGRLVSLPAPLTRQGRRWLVPVEFAGRALPLIYDTKLEYRPSSRLLIAGDLRVPHVAALYDDTGNSLRVTLDITPKATTSIVQDQNRLLVRIDADALDPALPPPPQQNFLTGIRAAEPNTIQMDLGSRFSSYRSSPPISSGAAVQVAIELLPAAGESPAAPSPALAPNTAGLPVFGGAARSSIRTIVLDPGHGGDDIGVKSATGILEKDVVLAVARRAKGAIEGRLGIRVLLTRDEDTKPDADTRAAVANNNKADLFISLHANGSPRASAQGALIYYLSLDRFGQGARRQSQADREVVPVYGGGTREFALLDWELAQAAHVQESAAFAGFIEQKMRGSANPSTVSVQKAPIRGLTAANMPAVLIEMGYLSNPTEEKTLASAEFQSQVAEALTEAVIAFRDYLEQAPDNSGHASSAAPPQANTR